MVQFLSVKISQLSTGHNYQVVTRKLINNLNNCITLEMFYAVKSRYMWKWECSDAKRQLIAKI